VSRKPAINKPRTLILLGKKVAKSLKAKLEKYRDKTGKMFGYANLEEGEWLAINKSGEKPILRLK
jgi:hypothetical protein